MRQHESTPLLTDPNYFGSWGFVFYGISKNHLFYFRLYGSVEATLVFGYSAPSARSQTRTPILNEPVPFFLSTFFVEALPRRKRSLLES